MSLLQRLMLVQLRGITGCLRISDKALRISRADDGTSCSRALGDKARYYETSRKIWGGNTYIVSDATLEELLIVLHLVHSRSDQLFR